MTDHRVGVTVRGVKDVLGGSIDVFVDALKGAESEKKMLGVAGEGDGSEISSSEGISRQA